MVRPVTHVAMPYLRFFFSRGFLVVFERRPDRPVRNMGTKCPAKRPSGGRGARADRRVALGAGELAGTPGDLGA